MQSARYNAQYRDLPEFTMEELLERHANGVPLSHQERLDVERALRARAANPFENAPLVPLDDQIEAVENKLEQMIRVAETGEQWAEIVRIEATELVPLLNLPVDELRRAAESLSLAAKLTPAEIAWARSHDWFDSVTPCGALIVTDRFTYKGRSYEERIIWGGTFAELRDWAGY